MSSRKNTNSLQPNVRKRDTKQMNSNTRSENRVEAFAVSQADLKTLEMWISRYRRVLYFVAHRLLGNHADAEEAVQSCIQSIPRKVPSLEHEGGFRAWLVRVLINEALAILRKNRLPSLVKGSARGLLVNPRRQPRIDPCGQFKENASWTAMERLRQVSDAYEF
jgi:RNA polymerase sigma factor (sigma-70 family)